MSALIGEGHWFEDMGRTLVSSAPLCISVLTRLATKAGGPFSACGTPENRVASDQVEYGKKVLNQAKEEASYSGQIEFLPGQ